MAVWFGPKNSMRHNLREMIYQVSRIWALTLKTGVSKVHLWQVYLRLFLGTIEDRNNHTLKVVNLDVGMKKKIREVSWQKRRKVVTFQKIKRD